MSVEVHGLLIPKMPAIVSSDVGPAIPKGHGHCGIAIQVTFCFALSVHVLCAASPVPLTASLAIVSVPPGGTAQLQVFLSSPQTLSGGSAVINLDPAIFGDIIAADVYSATGDQVGTANIQGDQVDLGFTSQTGGLGRLSGLPLLTITAPVLPTAKLGTTYSLAIQPGTTAWTDLNGVQYSVAVTSGLFTVGGDISVSNVGIAGGLLPTGTIVEIDGAGFTSGTIASIDGVSISSEQVVSQQKINLTLGAPAELDFRRVAVQNPGGTEVAFFPVLHGSYAARPTSGALANVQPIFPLQLYSGASGSSTIALQNPGLDPVTVRIYAEAGNFNAASATQTSVVLTPESSYLEAVPNSNLGVTVVPSAPIRVASGGPANLAAANPPPSSTSVEALALVPGDITYTAGQSPLPVSPQFYIVTTGIPGPFSVTASTESGRPWLTGSAVGNSCLGSQPSASLGCGLAFAQIDFTQLNPGLNRGLLTVTPQGPNPQPLVLPINIAYYTAPNIIASPSSIQVSAESDADQTFSAEVTSSLGPLGFSPSVTRLSGQDWLSVASSGNTTPAQLAITVRPSGLMPGSYSGNISLAGPNNTASITVSLTKLAPSAPVVTPSSLQFGAQVGQTSLPQQIIACSPFEGQGQTYMVTTSNGGNWLAVSPGVGNAFVTANPSSLLAGTYQGSISVTQAGEVLPASVTVTLTIYSGAPPPISANPATLSMSAAHGASSVTQSISVSTANLPLTLGVATSTVDGSSWLKASSNNSYSFSPMTPGTVTVTADATNLPPGVYSGTVTLSAPAGGSNTLSIPVSLNVGPAAPAVSQANGTPLVTQVLNAASQALASVAPGEIVTLFGQGIGPNNPAGFALGPDGKIATNLGGAQVMFDGVAAPVIYASSTQVNAVVPYEVSGSSATNVSVLFGGTTIAAGAYAVAPASPGIFTVGEGEAAVLNQDHSLNSPANPAARGSIIQIYGTGAGATTPAGVTGEITGSASKIPLLPAKVTIGGTAATVVYAGSAPDAISGLVQVNAIVPMNVTPGPSLPIVVSIGDSPSQKNVAIAVQ
jgi:uncharacterized protein (TIGR03437 family)